MSDDFSGNWQVVTGITGKDGVELDKQTPDPQVCFPGAGPALTSAPGHSIFTLHLTGTLPDRHTSRLGRVKLGPNRVQDCGENVPSRCGKENIQPQGKGWRWTQTWLCFTCPSSRSRALVVVETAAEGEGLTLGSLCRVQACTQLPPRP